MRRWISSRTSWAELSGSAGGHAVPDRSLNVARLNVTRAAKSAMRRISTADTELAAHLEATVHTGSTYVYTPDRVRGGSRLETFTRAEQHW